MSSDRFYVNSFHHGVDRVTFTLDRPKDGCDRIVCNVRDERFADLILRLFESGRPFDFEIDARQSEGVCSIKGIDVSFAAIANNDLEQPNNGTRFTTFLSSWRTYARRHHFATANPATAGNFVWLTVPADSALFSIVHTAFASGRMLNVLAGYPFINLIDRRPAATILDAEMIWQGLATEA